MERPTGITVSALIIGIMGIMMLLGGLAVVAGGAIFGSLAGMGGGGTVTVNSPSDSGSASVQMNTNTSGFGNLFAGMFVVLGIVFLILGAIQLFAAYKLTQGTKWAKIACIIFAALSLLNFPIGTLAGVVVLYFLLMDQKTKEFLEGTAAATPTAQPEKK